MHYAQALINIGKAFTARAYRSLFTVAFLFQSGFAFFTTFIGAYLIFRFGFTQGAIGDFFAIVGICIALTQIFVTGFAAKRFTPYAIVSAALLGATLTILAFTLAPSAWMLYLIIPFQAVSVGLIMANLTALISRSAPPEEQGRVLGINASVQALAQGVPPAIGGFIAAGIAPAAPLMTGSVIAFAGFLCFVLLARRGIGRAHPSSHAAPQSGH
jgi:predicted MFS family arabinose efflux permease